MIVLLLCCVIGFQPAARAQLLPATNYPTVGRTPICVAIGDFNGDGIPDLATANQGSGSNTGSVSILLGNGDGTFRPAVQYDTGSTDTISIATGDFNGDGILDLAVVNEESRDGSQAAQLDLLLGNGDGTFRDGMSYTVGYLGTSVATGDFNADGRLDLVVVTAIGSYLFLGNGDGTFTLTLATGFGVNAGFGIVAADLNHDGKLDLAVTNYNRTTVGVFLGNGDGTFRASGDYPAGNGVANLATGDFNGDGNLDLVVANPGNSFGTTVSVLLGNGDGTFRSPVSYPAGAEPITVAVGDMDGDGKLDLIVADLNASGRENKISLLLGKGDGTFQAPVFYVADANPAFVAVGDLNHDGRLDVVVANRNNDVSVLLNAGLPSSPPNLVTTQILTRSGGSVLVQLTVANIGGDAASNVVITDVKVGADQAMLLPQNIGTIAGGTSMQITLTVPGNVGAPGAASLLRVSGTFTGETFGASFRVTLP